MLPLFLKIFLRKELIINKTKKKNLRRCGIELMPIKSYTYLLSTFYINYEHFTKSLCKTLLMIKSVFTHSVKKMSENVHSLMSEFRVNLE